MTEQEKLEKLRQFDRAMREKFGPRWAPPEQAIQPAANGVGAGAEEPEKGQKIAKSSAVARAPETAAADGEQKIPEQLKTKPNKRENEFMMNLMILRNTLIRNGPACRERARLAGKWIWRDIRLVTVLISRIQNALLKTMPDRRDEYYAAYAKHGHYELHMDGPLRGTRMVLISDRNLAALCEAVMENECVMCMREGNQIDGCLVRKALLEVAPPTEIADGKWRKCEYRDAAGQLILGEDVIV